MLTPNGIADLYTVKAVAYARKQDTAQCRRYIAAAADTYQPDSVSADPPWLRNFTPAQLEGLLANARYELVVGGTDVGDRAAERVALIESLFTAFRRYPAERVRSKAITAASLATLLCLEGEQRAAYQMVEDAIALAGQIRSARVADDLRGLLRVFAVRRRRRRIHP
ncbi:MAG: hypothetical protein ACRDTE_00195 [Pseudonocardiaceae bacterium]